jgi:predicted RNA-binding protein with PUA-like domain
MKSDPDTFGWEHLKGSRDATTEWDGVRNYQARNFLRDDVKVGDGVLFYHSRSDKAVMGTARVVKAGYPDPTQFDRKEKGYDPKSNPDDPRWYAVDIRVDREFATPVALADMRDDPALADMLLLKRGNRLSVFPVSAAHYRRVVKLGSR